MGEVLTSTVCAVCGGRYLSNLKACPHCGSVEKGDGKAGLSGKAVAWVDSFPIGIRNCPVCASPSIVKVGEFYRQAKVLGPEAVLARQLAPPSRPVFHSRVLGLFPAMVGIGSAFVVFSASVAISAAFLAPFKGQALPGWDIFLCFALGSAALAAGVVLSKRVVMKHRVQLEGDNREELDRWIGEMEVWERLYYCQNCEKISDPLVGRSAHLYAMANLLDR